MAILKMLGTGSAFNFDKRNTSAILEHDDYTILIDCGSTVPEDLKKRGLLDKVTDIFITHTHSDHIGGLELFFQWRYFVSPHFSKAKAPRLHVTQDILDRLRTLEFTGLGKIQDAQGRPLNATLETYCDINVIDYSYLTVHFGTLAVDLFKVEHVPGDFPAYGFQFRRNGKYITYSGDTRSVINFGHNGTMLHDCQFFDLGEGDVHCSIFKLDREVPDKFKKNFFLMHYGTNPSDEVLALIDKFGGLVEPDDEFYI